MSDSSPFCFLGPTARGQQVGCLLPTSPEARGPTEVPARRKAGTDHVPRSQTVAAGIPEGFHSLEPRRVAPGGAEAGGSPLADVCVESRECWTSRLRVQMTRAGG